MKFVYVKIPWQLEAKTDEVQLATIQAVSKVFKLTEENIYSMCVSEIIIYSMCGSDINIYSLCVSDFNIYSLCF